MNIKVATSIIILTTLAMLMAGCSGDGDVTGVTGATATALPAAPIEVTEEPAKGASATPSGIESESCTDQGTGASMEYVEALAIAEVSECVQEGQLLETHFCNENSGTWWIDMAADKPGCNPACVVNVNSASAEINWRCTGAIPPANDEGATGEAPASDAGAAPAVFDYSGWGTHINEKHGYEVKYPPGVRPLWDDEAKAVTFEGPLEDNEHWPMFFVGHETTSFYRPDEGATVREWVESHSGQPENSFSEDTEIAGVEAYHVVQARSPQSYASDQYYFIKDGQMYSIGILHAGDRQDWQMYDQFLQSFTFLEPDEPISSGAAVEAWRGIISTNPPGTQSRYFLERQDGQRWVVGTSDEALWSTLAEAAWRGVEVQLDGVETPMSGLIDVTSITFVGEPATEARNLSYFARPSASSVLPADRLGTYHEWSAMDGLLESPWCEGAAGSGAGEWLQLTFDEPVEATMIRLANGYDFNDDIFAKNNRLKNATLVFSDGERIEWQFDDTRGWQMVPLARAPGPNIITTSVKLLIEDVYPGSLYDDTCIAELEVWGRPQ